MKILYLPIGNQTGTISAFKNSEVDLTVFDFYTYFYKNGRQALADNFLSMIGQIKPDLVHMQLQFEGLISPDVIIAAKVLVPHAIFTNWSGDIYKTVVPYFVDISKVVDYSFLSNRGQIQLYLDAGGKNIFYWQIGYDPTQYMNLGQTDFKYKITFTANNYPDDLYPDARLRRDVMVSLRSVFGDKAGLFGKNYPYNLNIKHSDPDGISRLNNIYNDSLCVLSVSNFNDVEDYFSDRLLYCIASGRPTIVYRFPGIEKYFENGKEILVANNISDIIKFVSLLDNDKELANTIGNNGSKRVVEHTYDARIKELYSFVGLR
jgi:spore maturation protein CgeB